MSPSQAPFTVQRKGAFDVVEITERSLVNRAEMDAVAAGIDALIARNPKPCIVIDFGQVTHVSSNFLGKLMAFHKRIRAKHGDLSIANVNPRIREVFTVTKLDTQITIRDSVAAATGGVLVRVASSGRKRSLIIAIVAAALVAVAAIVFLLARN